MVWFLQGSLHSTTGLPWHTRMTIRVLAAFSGRPEAIAINSRSGRSHHARAGYHPRRWIVLPNGCDTARFRADAEDRAAVRAELGIGADAIVAITVARVHPQKDHATLLAAAEAARTTHPALELVLVGTGTQALAITVPDMLPVHGLAERTEPRRARPCSSGCAPPSRRR